jgi:hypothetical protein
MPGKVIPDRPGRPRVGVPVMENARTGRSGSFAAGDCRSGEP